MEDNQWWEVIPTEESQLDLHKTETCFKILKQLLQMKPKTSKVLEDQELNQLNLEELEDTV